MEEDLFAVMLESQLAQLRALGCEAVAFRANRGGGFDWKLPNGAVVTEAEALAWLERENPKE